MRRRYIRIAVLYFLLGLISFSLKGQLAVEGRILLKGEKNSSDAVLKIEKNSEIVDKIDIDKKGNFKCELNINNEYILHFTKDGYVTKRIEVNTNVPSGKESKSFQPLYFEVEIFKSVPDSELGPFEYPVGKIVYNSSIEEFDYDVNYSRKVENKIRKKEKAYKKAREKYEEKQRQKKIAQKKKKLKKEKEKERQEKREFIQQQKEKAKKRKEKLKKQQEEERKRKEELKRQVKKRAEERADSIAKLEAEKRKERKEKVKKQQEKIQEKLAKQEEKERQQKKEKLNEIEKSVKKKKQKKEQERQKELQEKQNIKQEVKKKAEERKKQKQKRRKLNEQEKKELVSNQISNTKKEYLRQIYDDSGSYKGDADNLDFSRKVDEYEYERWGIHVKRIIIQKNEKIDVYHKVKHDWGGVFYFKDFKSIGKYQFEIESSED